MEGGREGIAQTHTPAGAPRLLAGHARAPAGCKEQRRECTSPSSSCSGSEPRVWGEGKPANERQLRRWRLGSSLGGLGVEERSQSVRVAPGRTRWPVRRAGGLASCSRVAAHLALTRPWPPGPQPCASLARVGSRARVPHTAAPRQATGPTLSTSTRPGARRLSAEPPARPSCPLLRSGPTDRRERSGPPRRLAPDPPSAARSNQRRPRGGYQGDAAPRPAGGGAGGNHALFSRQNSKAGRATLQPPPRPSRDEEDLWFQDCNSQHAGRRRRAAEP